MKTSKQPAIGVFFLLLFFLSCKREEVDIPLTVDFTYEVVGADYSIPVQIAFTNKTAGAQQYKWSFEGGNPEVYNQKEPGTITFSKAGTIKVKLEAWNDAERKEKEITILLDSVVKAVFEAIPQINNLGPTDFTITNKSTGGTQFSWQFEGGTPATATGRDPGPVHFASAGTYRITLEARNDRGEKNSTTQQVTVLPALTASFDIVPSFEDADYEAPLTATLANHTTGARQHQWSTTGGSITQATDSIPTIYFPNPGTYTVTYEAGNSKQTAKLTRTIVVKPNTRMHTFTNVQLGINTAHATIGSFFSTKLGKVLKASDVTTSNGADIDIVFFGLSESFSYNLFIRPDTVQFWTFPTIPNATATQWINTQESCGCGVSITPADFDAVTDGSAFDPIAVVVTPDGKKAFDKGQVPRVVLFQNAAGKKGAIKIKQYVAAGQQSYMVCDIKVQKD